MLSDICPKDYKIVYEALRGKDYEIGDLKIGEIEEMYYQNRETIGYVIDVSNLKIQEWHIYEAVRKVKQEEKNSAESKPTIVRKNTKYKYKNSHRDEQRKREKEFKEILKKF